jgi:hypothetical protein
MPTLRTPYVSANNHKSSSTINTNIQIPFNYFLVARLVAVIVGAGRGGVAAVGAVLGTLRLGGLASVEGVRVAGDLVAAAVIASLHLRASAGHALVVLAMGHDGAGEGAVGVQLGGGSGARAVEEAVGVLAQPVVATVVACNLIASMHEQWIKVC